MKQKIAKALNEKHLGSPGFTNGYQTPKKDYGINQNKK